MPKATDRQRILNDIEETMKMAALNSTAEELDYDSELDVQLSPLDDEEESDWEALAKLYFLICQRRFLSPRRNLAKSRDFVLNYFLNQSDDNFRKITRVLRETFHHIVSLIEYEPIFHNVSSCPQAPVHWQLACALGRLGNDDQGVSHARSKLIWGIGQGTVHLYTHRVVKSLWRLRHQYISWPTPEERIRISKRMEAKGFKHCVGFVDGTTFPVHKKPAEFGNLFMDRKKRHSVNAQIMTDDQCRIIFFMAGHPGSVGDSRVFSGSIVVQRPDLAFSGRQYLLSDSAYGATTTIIPAYKDNQRDNPSDVDEPCKIELFNTYLAKARVVNEHTIGVLKGRWSALRGMRVDLHKREDMKTFVQHAAACVVLHNICLTNDPWDDEYDDESEDEPDPDVMQELRRRRILSPSQRRRYEIRRACLSFYGQD